MTDRDRDSKPPPEDLERTVIMPTPGGRRRSTGPAVAPPAPAVHPAAGPTDAPARARPRPGALSDTAQFLSEASGRNVLLRAAATSFALVRHVRSLQHHDDVPALREGVIEAVKAFESKARELGASAESAYAGRYALCALIDEMVLGMPWGADSLWNEQSLLATLHNETRGGEKFFQILSRMSEDPARNIDLLELLYVSLCLGFRGKYGIVQNGAAQLSEIEHRLYQTIRKQRGAPETELSPRWRGISNRGAAVARFLPLWVVPVLVCSAAVLLYTGFSYSLNSDSDSAFERLNEIGRGVAPRQVVAAAPIPPPPKVVAATQAPAPPSLPERLNAALLDEVRQGLVEVRDEGDGALVRIHNRGLFASGSAQVSNSHRALLAKIGAALDKESGPVLVLGHTDSQPIRTLQFPSNWHLSAARAKSVAELVGASMSDPSRLQPEGRADKEPIAGNDTAEGREANRRIEIKVFGT